MKNPGLKYTKLTWIDFEPTVLLDQEEPVFTEIGKDFILELEKLKASYQGVKDMKRTPDVLVVVDGHYEDLALAEAAVLKTTTISLLGSTGDIDKTTYFVPCNVNSIKALAFVLGELKSAIKAKKSEEKKPMGRTDTLAPKAPIAAKATTATAE